MGSSQICILPCACACACACAWAWVCAWACECACACACACSIQRWRSSADTKDARLAAPHLTNRPPTPIFALSLLFLLSFFLFSLLCCTVLQGSWTQTDVALQAVPHIDPKVVSLASSYAMWSLLWLWPRSAFFVTHKYLQANNIVNPQLVISAVFVATNLGCNIMLVHTGTKALPHRHLVNPGRQ